MVQFIRNSEDAPSSVKVAMHGRMLSPGLAERLATSQLALRVDPVQ